MKSPPLHLVREALSSLSAYRTPPEPPPIKLDANESPYDLPPEARARIAQVLSEASLHRYPDLLATDLRRALAHRLNCSGDELVIGVGSDEAIVFLMAALSRPRPGAERAVVITPSPTFVMIPITAQVHGLTPIEVPLRDDFTLDLPAMLAAIAAHRPNLVYLATPNNPTGNAHRDDDLRAIVEAASDAVVVIDEAYGPFAGRSLAPWTKDHPNVVMLGTLSKIGLAAMRLGWAQMHPALAAQVEKTRPPYNLNTYAQLAGRVVLEEFAPLLERCVASIVSERARLAAALETYVKVYPSQANFVLVAHDDAAAIHAHLLTRGIAVRRFAHEPRLACHLRITVGTPAENDALLSALAERG